MWWQLYDVLPTEFDYDPYLSVIQEYSDLSGQVHELKKPQLQIIRDSFAKSKVEKTWMDMVDFVDNNFCSIDRQRMNLRNQNLI
jgi:hypothetical protein